MGLVLLVIGLTAIAVAITLAVSILTRESSEPTGVAGGLASIETIYSGKAASGREPAQRDRLPPPVMRRLRGLAERLSPASTRRRLQHGLDLAGNPGGWTSERILEYKGTGLVLAGAVFGLVGLGNGILSGLVFGPIGAAIGFFLPDLLLYNAGLRRQDAIARSLPDVLDLLTISVEAGLGFDAALSRVARNTTGPLAGELARVLQEMQIGKSREEALRALAVRTAVDEMRTFVSALVQASDLGIPIGNVLREQSKEMRIKRRQRVEETAQKVPVKITIPVVLCILPALFIVVIGPGVLGIMSSGVFR
jgi:tight adherence protein C